MLNFYFNSPLEEKTASFTQLLLIERKKIKGGKALET